MSQLCYLLSRTVMTPHPSKPSHFVSSQLGPMPRRRRFLSTCIPAHIIQRGVNKQICFACDEDIAAYGNWLHKGAEKFAVSIHAWVFMANHAHLLITANEAHGISNCMQYLGRYYVRYFNYRYKRTGTLFEDRFKSHLMQSNRYFLIC